MNIKSITHSPSQQDNSASKTHKNPQFYRQNILRKLLSCDIGYALRNYYREDRTKSCRESFKKSRTECQ